MELPIIINLATTISFVLQYFFNLLGSLSITFRHVFRLSKILVVLYTLKEKLYFKQFCGLHEYFPHSYLPVFNSSALFYSEIVLVCLPLYVCDSSSSAPSI